MGPTARRILTAGAHGKVLASVSKAIYLVSSGDLLWLSPADQPAHTRAVLTSAPLGRPAPGTPFRVSGDRIVVGEIILDSRGAEAWDDTPIAAVDAAPLAGLFRSYDELLAVLALLDARGMGRLLPLLAERRHAFPSFLDQRSPRSRTGDPVGRPRAYAVRPYAAPSPGPTATTGPTIALGDRLPLATLRACTQGDVKAVLELAPDLIGLGSGLTPSGDDFLGGLFFAAHYLHAAYPSAFAWDEDSVVDLVSRHAGSTNRISRTVLMDLAEGHGPEPAHSLMAALATGQGPDGALSQAVRLTRIGHSSGWDLLTGLLAGVLLAAGSRGRPVSPKWLADPLGDSPETCEGLPGRDRVR